MITHAFKAEIVYSFGKSGWTISRFAREMKCSENEIRRILDINHRTKIETLERAATLLSIRFTLTFIAR